MAVGMAFMFAGLLMNSNIVQSKAIDGAITAPRQQTASADLSVAQAQTAEIKEGLITQDRTQTLSITALGLSGLAALGVSILTAIGLGSIASLPVIGAIIAGIVGLGFALGFTVLSGLGIIVPVAAGTGGGLSLLVIAIVIGLLIILFPPAAIIAILILGGSDVGVGTVIMTVLSAAGAALVFLVTAILGAIVTTQTGSIIVQMILAAVNVGVDIAALLLVALPSVLIYIGVIILANLIVLPFSILSCLTAPIPIIGALVPTASAFLFGSFGILRDILLAPFSALIFPLAPTILGYIHTIPEGINTILLGTLSGAGGIASISASLISIVLKVIDKITLDTVGLTIAMTGTLLTGRLLKSAALIISNMAFNFAPSWLGRLVDFVADLAAGVVGFFSGPLAIVTAPLVKLLGEGVWDIIEKGAFDTVEGTVVGLAGAITYLIEFGIKTVGVLEQLIEAVAVNFGLIFLLAITGFCVVVGILSGVTIIGLPFMVICMAIAACLFLFIAIMAAIHAASVQATNVELLL